MDADDAVAESMSEDSSSSDDSDSDFDEIEASVQDVALITKLETELESNPNLYNVHLQVCSLCSLQFCMIEAAYTILGQNNAIAISLRNP